MMLLSRKLAASIAAAVLAAMALPARADDRSLLDHCKALVQRAAPSQVSGAVSDAEIQHCQQVIREWTLRDSRMSVDENGKPLR